MASGGDKTAPMELSVLDRQWVVASLRTQHRVLVRSAQKELPGSEISVLRNREIQQLAVLLAKFSA